jgi:hypothetical protein
MDRAVSQPRATLFLRRIVIVSYIHWLGGFRSFGDGKDSKVHTVCLPNDEMSGEWGPILSGRFNTLLSIKFMWHSRSG